MSGPTYWLNSGPVDLDLVKSYVFIVQYVRKEWISKNKHCFCSETVPYETIDEMDCVVNKWTGIFGEFCTLFC
jgi:hypothetical protein